MSLSPHRQRRYVDSWSAVGCCSGRWETIATGRANSIYFLDSIYSKCVFFLMLLFPVIKIREERDRF